MHFFEKNFKYLWLVFKELTKRKPDMRSRFPLPLFFKVVCKSPDLLSSLVRGQVRKHIGIRKDYRHGTGEALQKPYQISLRITNACNHRCAVCGQYGKQGYMKTTDRKYLLKTLPVEIYKDLVDQVADYKPIFYITGGEPFLYPAFLELMN